MTTEMQSKEKLAESEYFLELLRSNFGDLRIMKYCFSAFMSAVHSTMDIMLYDCAEAFELRLTREERFEQRDFALVARAKENKNALEFLAWWKQKVGLLSKNPLWNTRHVINHRGYPPVKQTVFVSGTILAQSSVSYELPSIDEVIVSGSVGPVLPSNAWQNIVTNPEIYLEEFPDIDLRKLCQMLWSEVGAIVSEAEKKFLSAR
ncbi:MAG TPA: hypothetical protein VNE86_02140 [Nitrososphaerales archaeon]|nr:hypothetical protein [Nitrososphaerales archaeon]